MFKSSTKSLYAWSTGLLTTGAGILLLNKQLLTTTACHNMNCHNQSWARADIGRTIGVSLFLLGLFLLVITTIKFFTHRKEK